MARRLNKPLVYGLIGSLVLVLGIGAAALIVWKIKRPSIPALIARGEAAMAQKPEPDYEAAVKAFGQAANRDTTNTSLALKALDAYQYTINGDEQKLLEYINGLKKVLLVDPKNKTALSLLVENFQEIYANNPSDRNFNLELDGFAQKLYDLDKTDRKARLALVLCVLEPWAQGAALDPNLIDQRVQMCVDLTREDPTDPEAVSYMIRLRQAEGALAIQNNSDRGAAEVKFKEALKIADDVLAKCPTNVGALYGRYGTLTLMAQYLVKLPLDREAIAQRAARIAEASKSLDAANAAVKPGDKLFLEVRTERLRTLEGTDVKKAEAEYRKLLEEAPNIRGTRIRLAELISRQPTRRPEAIALLKSEWKSRDRLKGLESVLDARMREEEFKRLCQFRIDQLDDVADPAAHEKELQEIETIYKQLAMRRSDDPALLRIKGGIEVQRDRIYDAINTFGQAEKLSKSFQSGNRQDRILRLEILYDFASAHLRLNQTGPAKEPLQEIIKNSPSYHPARFALARLYIKEGNFAEALKEATYLREKLPDNSAVNVLYVQSQGGNVQILAEQYAAMKEETEDQLRLKLRTANLVGNSAEMVRIGRKLTEQFPKAPENWLLLTQSLVKDGKRDEAIEQLRKGQSINNDPKLLPIITLMSGKSNQDEVIAEVLRVVTEIQDPSARELARAEVFRRFNRLDDMVKSLNDAIQLNPNDARPQNMLFSYYLNQKKWDDASAMLPKLKAINADQTEGALREVELTVAKAMTEGSVMRRQQMFDDAISKSKMISTKWPSIADTYLLLGKLYMMRGQPDRASENYSETLNLAPTNIEALQGIIAAYNQLGRYDEAKKKIKDARALLPTDEGFIHSEIEWEILHGNPALAIDRLKEAVKQFPDYPANWAMLGWAQMADAMNLQRKNNPSASLEQFQAAIKTFSDGSAKFPGDLRLATYRAEAYRAAGDPKQANSVLEDFAKRPGLKDRESAVIELAKSYVRGGDLAKGEQCLKDFLNAAPEPPLGIVLMLSEVQLQGNRVGDAINTLGMRPQDTLCQRRRAELLLSENKVEEARNITQKLIDAGEPPVEVMNLRSFIELRTGNLNAAREFITETAKRFPNDPGMMFYRAQLNLVGLPPDLEAAVQDLTAVREALPTNIEARLSLAGVLLRQHMRQEAERELTAAWQSNRDSKVVLMELLRFYTTPRAASWGKVPVLLTQAREQPQFINDPDLMQYEANYFLTQGRDKYPKAIEAGENMLKVANTPQALMSYLDILVRADKANRALEVIDAELAKNPDAWWLMQSRALAHLKLDHREEALKAFDAAIDAAIKAKNSQAVEQVGGIMASSMGPKAAISRLQQRASGNLRLRLLMARLMADTNDADNAARIVNDILDKNRAELDEGEIESAQRIAALAAMQSPTPDPNKSCELYEQLYRKAPNDWLLLNNYACALAMRGSRADLELAYDRAQRAAELTKKEKPAGYQYVQDTLGWVMVLLGEQNIKAGTVEQGNKMVDGGLLLLKATAEEAKFPEVTFHLAKALMVKKDYGNARIELDNVIDRIQRIETDHEPYDPSLKVRINELKAELDAIQKVGN